MCVVESFIYYGLSTTIPAIAELRNAWFSFRKNLQRQTAEYFISNDHNSKYSYSSSVNLFDHLQTFLTLKIKSNQLSTSKRSTVRSAGRMIFNQYRVHQIKCVDNVVGGEVVSIPITIPISYLTPVSLRGKSEHF